MSQMYLNVLHRLDVDSSHTDYFEALQYQQDAAHRAGLKTTLLLGVEALYDPLCVEYALTQSRDWEDELGLNLHELTKGGLGEKFEIKDSMFYLMPFEKKKGLLEYVMDLFREKIGYYPKAVTSYVLDARTLNWMHQRYPMVKAAITSCFEEGVKMFYGNQNQWYLFSDGGPWGAYFPSKTNSLAEAKDEADYCGIVGLPHLNRDMVMAITSRDDLFSSHPTNVVRAKAYDTEKMTIPYMKRFIDAWVDQLQYNPYVYYNVYVNASWLTDDTMLDESGDFSKKLYSENMNDLGEKVKEGLAVSMTMSEFAVWMEENIKKGTPEVNLWHDLICGSKREFYWYIDPCFRVTLDSNIGGAICDLRPHVGRLERNLGNDTPNLQNMNYPFLISCEHRGGVHNGSIHTLKIEVNGQESDLALKRTKAVPYMDENHCHGVRFEPISYTIGGVKVTVESRYEFLGDGRIKIIRSLLGCSDPDAKVVLKEYHCGCWGDTTYPEDMRGIVLSVQGKQGENKLPFEYLGREIHEKEPVCAKAEIPQLNIQVTLQPISEDTQMSVTEGWMFSPFYRMEISKELKPGEELQSCLRIQQAES